MHVIADIGGDKIIACHGVAGEVARQFRERPDMRDAIGIVWIVGAGDIIKVNERIMPGNIVAHGRQGNIGAADVLLISLPGNVGILQQCHQMTGGVLAVGAGTAVIGDAEVRPRFEPKVIRLAGVIARRVVILRAVRRHGQQCVVDVRGGSVAQDVGPIIVFHQNNEDGLDGRQITGTPLVGQH